MPKLIDATNRNFNIQVRNNNGELLLVESFTSREAFDIVSSRIVTTLKNGGLVSIKFENRLNAVKTAWSVLSGLTVFAIARELYIKKYKKDAQKR